MHALLERVLAGEDGPDCRCSVATEGDTLTVDAAACDGRLGEAPACRGTVADALGTRDVDRIRVRSRGVDRFYDDAAALLRAAGRFAALVREVDPTLAARARTDPLAAARAAAARASPIDEIARDAELLSAAAAVETPFRPAVAPSIAGARVETAPPAEARLRTARELATGATVRIYDAPGAGAATYHLLPVEAALSEAALAALADAYDVLAERADEPAPIEAVREVAGSGDQAPRSGASTADAPHHVDPADAPGEGVPGDASPGDTPPADGSLGSASSGDAPPLEAPPEVSRADDGELHDGAPGEGLECRTLAAVLRKHTRGYGVLEDCFADPAVSDIYASGPAAGTPLWVVADGEQLRTNVRLGEDGAAAIASRLRRTSGRPFSRASPTIDATARIADEDVRVAGVLDPATRGHAFAFRSGGQAALTLPALVANGTLPPSAAGLLSVAVRRSAAGLIAGTRGAGKTTTLGALLWELPATTRTVVIEDTPELPVATLQDHGRDVQPLHTTLEDGPGVTPTEALRTALRLGESAIVLGEVRGEEAGVLYEAMRVGASGETVLGTIHGDGGADVHERVVGDLGVPASSFAATDLVVTCEQYRTASGERGRRVAAIEEVVDGTGDDVRFESLYALDGGSFAGDAPRGDGVPVREDGRRDGGLAPTGRIDRGNSRLVQQLARPGESYAAVRELVADRGSYVRDLAARGTTAPDPVTTAYARRGDLS